MSLRSCGKNAGLRLPLKILFVEYWLNRRLIFQNLMSRAPDRNAHGNVFSVVAALVLDWGCRYKRGKSRGVRGSGFTLVTFRRHFHHPVPILCSHSNFIFGKCVVSSRIYHRLHVSWIADTVVWVSIERWDREEGVKPRPVGMRERGKVGRVTRQWGKLKEDLIVSVWSHGSRSFSVSRIDRI